MTDFFRKSEPRVDKRQNQIRLNLFYHIYLSKLWTYDTFMINFTELTGVIFIQSVLEMNLLDNLTSITNYLVSFPGTWVCRAYRFLNYNDHYQREHHL